MTGAARSGNPIPHNVPTLPERLRAAMNEARKNRDQPRTLLLSTILADLKNREFEIQHAASDDETVEVLRRGIKRRREAAEQYRAAGRADRAEAELNEVRVLETFLPPAVDPEEIRRAVRDAIAAGATEVGKVMGQVMPQFKGRADGKVVNQIVREELAGGT
ncbi:MAG TPA: GatB/YqeY domain-containing protein [Gemmatimonadales bacterium]|nr:GatB/YqeY domain-containing protein [Gemmatimonadales bacterium]